MRSRWDNTEELCERIRNTGTIRFYVSGAHLWRVERRNHKRVIALDIMDNCMGITTTYEGEFTELSCPRAFFDLVPVVVDKDWRERVEEHYRQWKRIIGLKPKEFFLHKTGRMLRAETVWGATIVASDILLFDPLVKEVDHLQSTWQGRVKKSDIVRLLTPEESEEMAFRYAQKGVL